MPTSLPTFAPPVAKKLYIKGIYSNATGEVNAQTKLQVMSTFRSSDFDMAFAWSLRETSIGTRKEIVLSHGPTTATPLNNEYLVLKPNVLTPGKDYVFKLTVTNRYGEFSAAELNVTAGLPPYNGTLVVNPLSGLAMLDTFSFFAKKFVDETRIMNESSTQLKIDTLPDDLPLKYEFRYGLVDGNEITFRKARRSRGNVSTWLPIGHGSKFELPVAVVVSDIIGSTTRRNNTVLVEPPGLDVAVKNVTNQISTILALKAQGRVDSAIALLFSASEVLNFVFNSTTPLDTYAQSAASARSSLISIATGLASSYVRDPETAEGVMACTHSLSRQARASLTSADHNVLLNQVAIISNISAETFGRASQVTAQCGIETVANLIQSGMLERSHKTSGRRQLLTGLRDVAATLNMALAHLGDALAGDLIAGEDAIELKTKWVGLTSRVVDRQSMYGGLSLDATVARLNTNMHTSSFRLPYDLLDGIPGVSKHTPVSIVLTNWASNPYNRETNGMLQNGSAVDTLTVGGGKYDKIIHGWRYVLLKVPLPSSASAMAVEVPATFDLQCNDTNFLNTVDDVTSMDTNRQQHCNDDELELAYGRDYEEFRMSNRTNRTVRCDAIGREYTMKCANRTGIVKLTCPVQFSSAVCEYWDGNSQRWATEGCHLKSYDFTAGSVACNCSRLGTFAAQQSSDWTARTERVRNIQTLQLYKRIGHRAKNHYIVHVVVGILMALCAVFYYQDMVARRLVRMNNLAGAFKSQNIQTTLNQLHFEGKKLINDREYEELHEQLSNLGYTIQDKVDELHGKTHRQKVREAATRKSGQRRFEFVGQDIPGHEDSPLWSQNGLKSSRPLPTPDFAGPMCAGRRSSRMPGRAPAQSNRGARRKGGIDLQHIIAAPEKNKTQRLRVMGRRIGEEEFDCMQERLLTRILSSTKLWKNWASVMITENDILGFVPYPPSWTTEQVAKRGVYLLAKVVTLLFLACLAGPKAYMCSKDGNKDGRLDVQSFWLRNSFVQFPDFWYTVEHDGWIEGLRSVRSTAQGNRVAFMMNSLWLLPVWWYFSVVFLMRTSLERSDRLNQDRLMEQEQLVLVRPHSMAHVRDALIQYNLLLTARYILKRQLTIMDNPCYRVYVRKQFSGIIKGEGVGGLLHGDQVKRLKRSVLRHLRAVIVATEEMNIRIEEIRTMDRKEDASWFMLSHQTFWGFQYIVAMVEHWHHRRDLERDMARMVGIGTLPRHLQLSMHEHVEILKMFQPRQFRKQNVLQYLKTFCYEKIAIKDIGVMRDGSSMDHIRFQKKWATNLAMFYLLGCICYVAYSTFIVEDNVLINSILLTAAVSYTAGAVITGPAYLLLRSGLLPWLAAQLVLPDVLQHLHKERKNAINSSTAIECVTDDDEEIKSPMRGILSIGRKKRDDDAIAYSSGTSSSCSDESSFDDGDSDVDNKTDGEKIDYSREPRVAPPRLKKAIGDLDPEKGLAFVFSTTNPMVGILSDSHSGSVPGLSQEDAPGQRTRPQTRNSATNGRNIWKALFEAIDEEKVGSLSEEAIEKALETTPAVNLALEDGLELPKGTGKDYYLLLQRVFQSMFAALNGDGNLGSLQTITAIEFADDLHARRHQVRKWKKAGSQSTLEEVFFKDAGGSFPTPDFMEAKFRHDVELEGDLQFSVGDRIRVIDVDPSGWWHGQNTRTGMVGEFPLNFTAEITRKEISQQRETWRDIFDTIDENGSGWVTRGEIAKALRTKSEGRRLLESRLGLPENTVENMPRCFDRVFQDMNADHYGRISFVEFSDYFQRRFIQVKSRDILDANGEFRKGKRYRLSRIFFDGEDIDEYMGKSKVHSTVGLDAEDRPPNPGFVFGVHDHEAEMDDDLVFLQGDRIRVIQTDRSGWWKGQNLRTGATGEFPYNFTSPT